MTYIWNRGFDLKRKSDTKRLLWNTVWRAGRAGQSRAADQKRRAAERDGEFELALPPLNSALSIDGGDLFALSVRGMCIRRSNDTKRRLRIFPR
jgi:hypothetical protein